MENDFIRNGDEEVRRARKELWKSVKSQRPRPDGKVPVGVKVLTETQWFWQILCCALFLRLAYLWQFEDYGPRDRTVTMSRGAHAGGRGAGLLYR